jgi:hypothetical protein
MAHERIMFPLKMIDERKKTATPARQFRMRPSVARDPTKAQDETITAIRIKTGPDQKEHLPENH